MVARFENLRLDLGFILEELSVDGAFQCDDARILCFDEDRLGVHSSKQAHDVEEGVLSILLRFALSFSATGNTRNSCARHARGPRGIASRWISARRVLRLQWDFRRED